MSLYHSILGRSPSVDFETAVLRGLAPDGGLYLPTKLPHVSYQQLEAWKKLSYPDLAYQVLSLFIDEVTVPEADLKSLINTSFSTFSHPEVIPHHELAGNYYVQELFHGPTLSFKDVAMGFVVNLLDYFLRRRGERRTLMVATSGDTGPAAAHASIGKTSLSTWLFFPTGLITKEQERQMTTIIAPNVHSAAIDNCRNGSDDLDELIASCFANDAFREEMQLSSVNSINWARVMTQTVHYFYGYLRHAKQVGDLVNFAVPCGAFGNMCAGSMARKMGLPVGTMIVATNTNLVLSQALKTGKFANLDIKNTLASAIDISVPMNFWRHLYFSLNGDQERIWEAWKCYNREGAIQFSPEEHAAFSHGFRAFTVSDEMILATTRSLWQQENYLLDPHGAVAVAAAQHFQSEISGPIICLATAHPSKFPETIRLAIGELPEQGTHDSLKAARFAGERKYIFNHINMQQAVPEVMRAVMTNQR